MPQANIPADVLPELVWDHDFGAFRAELEDPFLAAARLHRGLDVIWGTDVGYGRSGSIPTRRRSAWTTCR